jgi:hypothetical protein
MELRTHKSICDFFSVQEGTDFRHRHYYNIDPQKMIKSEAGRDNNQDKAWNSHKSSSNRSEYNHRSETRAKTESSTRGPEEGGRTEELALDAAPDLAPRLLARLAGHLEALHGHGLELLGPLLHLLAEPAHLLRFFSSRALFATVAQRKAIEEIGRRLGGRGAV